MIVGIDLGTTNSVIAYMKENKEVEIITNKDGDKITPSVILFENDNIVVGRYAKECALADPFNVVQFVKRQMGNKDYKFINDEGIEYSAEELSSIILKKLIEDAQEYIGEEIKKAVVTVPAYFDDATRKATQDAGKIIGLDIVKIINEPTAAAIAFSDLKSKNNQTVLVYDLGGGTFDVTILGIQEGKVAVKATGGDKNLGGFDFDNQIISYVVEEFNRKFGVDIEEDDDVLQELREKAEMCKKQLSARSKSKIVISSQGNTLKVDLTKEKFEQLIKPIISRTELIIEQVFEDANINSDEIDKILLIGGSTRIPLISDWLQKLTGIKPSKEMNPDEAVAIGAAIQASMINEDIEYTDLRKKDNDSKVKDVNSHSIGVVCRDSDADLDKNSIILKRNTELPAVSREGYMTVCDNQEEIFLRITEGEDENLEYVRVVGETILKLPSNVPEATPIDIEITLDENQIIHCFAYIGEEGRYLGEVHIERKSNRSDEEIEAMKGKISKIKVD